MSPPFKPNAPHALANKLDPAIRSELRRKEYFNWRGPWNYGHPCNGKTQFYYLEVVEEDGDLGCMEDTDAETNGENEG